MLIIAAVILLVAGTAGLSGYRAWNSGIKTAQTDTLLEALEAENIATSLEQTGPDLRPGMRGIALLTAGGTLLNDNKTE